MDTENEANDSRPDEWSRLDLRSLALFRILLGSFVLIDLLLRLADLEAFYTDAGVLSRRDLVASPFADFWLCFHLGTGTTFGQAMLFLVAIAFAIGLIVGWRTPWMLVACWVMTNSLQARNPFINDRGDLELVLMLFWGFFLPLGARFSVDAKNGRPAFGSHHGLAPAALVIQFASIYIFTAVHKYGDFWLARGDGLKYSLISPLFSTDLSVWLAQSAESLLKPLNYAVVAGELFLGLLLLIPFQVATMRIAAVFCAITFHLSIASLFGLGLFPFIAALLPLVLLPGETWDLISQKWSQLASSESGGEEFVLPRPFKAALLAALVLAVSSNLSFRPDTANFWRPPGFETLARALRLEQHWELFSPMAPYYGNFKLIHVDPQHQRKILFEGPSRLDKPNLQSFPNHRWRMLMISSLYQPFQIIRPGLVARLVEKLDRTSATQQGHLVYQFEVRLVNKKGQLNPETTWLLHRETLSSHQTPKPTPTSHDPHHGHEH